MHRFFRLFHLISVALCALRLNCRCNTLMRKAFSVSIYRKATKPIENGNEREKNHKKNAEIAMTMTMMMAVAAVAMPC